MSKVGSWNTVAANNNSTPPDGWPEGQAPSTVNDCAREMMAQIKTMVNGIEYIDLNHVPTFVNATSFTVVPTDLNNFTVGRRIKAGDGANTLYATIISVSASLVICQIDANANQLVFDSSLTTVALAVVQPTNVSLPPMHLQRKNLVINGSMDIWQRSAAFQIANNATTYTADRWNINISSGGALAITRWERSANASAVPTIAQAGTFLTNSLLISVSAIDAAVAAGEYAVLEYRVEGFDYRQLAQKPMNLSFWCQTRQSGIYAVSVANTGSDRSLVQNFTISTIATWTHFSIPIVKSPAAGTWDYSNGIGLRIRFCLEGGANFQGGAGNWTAVNLLCTSSQVNFLQSAGNTFAITGVQLEEGAFATPLEFRPYEQELSMCKRYFQKWPDATSSAFRVLGGVVSTSRALFPLQLPEEMRAAPTVGAPTLASVFLTDATGNPFGISAFTTNAIGLSGIVVDVQAVGTPLTLGQPSLFGISAGGANGTISLDAEL